MSVLSKKYALFIDELRIKRKMKVKELCEGICNERSYRRYVSGERTLPSEKIIQFCDNLRLSSNDFYYMFFNQDHTHHMHFSDMLQSIGFRQFDKYLELEKKIKKVEFEDQFYDRFYKHLQVKFKLETRKIDDYEAIHQYSQLIDFPKCCNSDVFDYVDLITLLSLMQLQTRIKTPSYVALDALERILTDDSIIYMSFNNRYTLLTVYSAVAVGYFRKKDYEKAMRLCNEGIDKCKKHGMIYPLANMYFVRSAIHYSNDEKEMAFIEAQKCLSSVITLENYKLYSHYINLMRTRFGEEFETYFNVFHQKHYSQQV